MDWGHEVLLKENYCGDTFFKKERLGTWLMMWSQSRQKNWRCLPTGAYVRLGLLSLFPCCLGVIRLLQLSACVCILSNYVNCRDHSPSVNCQLVDVHQLINSISLICERVALLHYCNMLAACAQLNFSWSSSTSSMIVHIQLCHLLPWRQWQGLSCRSPCVAVNALQDRTLQYFRMLRMSWRLKAA